MKGTAQVCQTTNPHLPSRLMGTTPRWHASPGLCQNYWIPGEMLDFRRFKEVIISYGTNSPLVKQMLNSWSTSKWIVPQDQKVLGTAVLAPGPQLQWRDWWKDEARTIRQGSRARGIDISSDWLLGEENYADLQCQSLYGGHTLALFNPTALNAWDRIEEVRKIGVI